jgi:hypothetical protein
MGDARCIAVAIVLAGGCQQVFGLEHARLFDTNPPAPAAVFLTAANRDIGDHFGWSIALSADASLIAIGAPGESSAATGVDGNQMDNSVASSGAVYIFERTGTTWTQTAYLKASNTASGAVFGHAVALSASGTTLVVGSPGEASAATGIGGNQADRSAANAGAAYVFVRDNQGWHQTAYVKASNTDAGDSFGDAVAISAGGNTIAIGAYAEASASASMPGDNSAPQAGAVYEVTRTPTSWQESQYIKSGSPQAMGWFGISLALSSDGSTLAVGAALETNQGRTEAGAAYAFGGAVAFIYTAPNGDAMDHFGAAVALDAAGFTLVVGAPNEASAATGIDGNEADNTAPQSGAAYVFPAGNAKTTYVKATLAEDRAHLGKFLGLSDDGATLVVGAYGAGNGCLPGSGAGVAYLYHAAPSWTPTAKLTAAQSTAGDNFGWPSKISGDATTIAIGAPGDSQSAGAVYVFATPP